MENQEAIDLLKRVFCTVEGNQLLDEWIKDYVFVKTQTPNDLYGCGWNDALRSFIISIKEDIEQETLNQPEEDDNV